MDNEIAALYSLDSQDSINMICKPLEFHLGVNYFSYNRIYNDGSYLLLSNVSPAYLKRYIIDLSIMSSFLKNSLKHSSLFRPNYYLQNSCCKVFCQVEQLKRRCGVIYDFSIVIRHKDFSEQYSFGSDKVMENKSAFYVRNIFLFDEFVSYFCINSKNIVDIGVAHYLAKYKASFDYKVMNDNLENEEALLSAFRSSAIFISNKLGEAVYLSKREAQCLALFSEGKICKEVAWELNISPRTVEYHLSNIKKRTLLNSKSQIISSYLKNACRFRR